MKENKLSFFRGLFNGLMVTLLILLLCFGCFMCGFNFHKDHTDLSYQSLSVKPQDIVVDNPVFNGSVIGVPVTYFSGSNFSSVISTVYKPVKINFSSSYVNIRFPGYFNGIDVGEGYGYTWNNFSFDTGLNHWITSEFNSSSLFVGLYVNNNFDFNPVKINLYSEPAQGINSYLSVFEYRDINNAMLRLHVAFLPSQSPDTDWNLSYRSYYLANTITDNQYYQSGYDYGYAQGKSDEQPYIYQQGYDAGNAVGYDLGYSAGVDSADKFTFVSLFGAMFDVPISMLIGLFNFNILGINLLNFVTGLLTIAVVLRLIKWVTGGR